MSTQMAGLWQQVCRAFPCNWLVGSEAVFRFFEEKQNRQAGASFIGQEVYMSEVRYLVAGDSAVCVEFGNEISPEINKKIRAFKIAVEKSDIPGIVETVPTYRSLLVHYHPEVIGFKALTEKFDKLMGSLSSIPIPPPTVIEIPVLYGGEMGPDIENVAEHNHKTVEEVINAPVTVVTAENGQEYLDSLAAMQG